ncbi:MAG: ABC transporter substrate-binding protein [Mogibacterium sp.]|nr:ABC transporter substrate-binding protein [Mogibacterium sp.]
MSSDTLKLKSHIKKRALSVIVLIMAAVLMLSGCGVSSGGAASPDKAPGTVISETENELTIIDQAGREVTVNRDPQSIALCYRVVVRFLLNLGVGDRISGMGKTEPFLEDVQPSLKETVDVGKGVADIEALASLKPDLFIHKASDTETLDAVQNIGIPSVGIDVESPEEMLTALDILGKVCGAEERALELSEYYETSVEMTLELAGTVSDNKKKTAIVMGSSIGKVADGSMLQGKMLESAGAVNCAADLKSAELWPTAGTEQIFSWDPDYIFITGSGASYTADDIYSDPAWSEMKAVKGKHVFMIPSAYDSWEFPGIVSSLGIEFMMSTMYPELLSDEQLEHDVTDFYMMAYGMELSREKLGY